jgi:RNA polymerase sigma-70 factor, ECF subfamily
MAARAETPSPAMAAPVNIRMNAAEFRGLYEANRAAVHSYFVGRTSDREAAADLTQEAFLRCWQHRDRLGGMADDGRRAWLFTVARNLSIDSARLAGTRAGVQRALTDDPVARPAMASAPASAAVLAAERAEVVGAAIARLPETQRVTLAMAAAGGLTSVEIATALGVPAGTVRYRLSEARRALAAELGTYDDEKDEKGGER